MTAVGTWHDFQPSSADDHACASCGVTAEDAVVERLTLECPAAACTHPANEGSACVFVRGDEGPECSYCEVAGAARFSEDDDDDGVDDEGFAEVERELSLADSHFRDLGHIMT